MRPDLVHRLKRTQTWQDCGVFSAAAVGIFFWLAMACLKRSFKITTGMIQMGWTEMRRFVSLGFLRCYPNEYNNQTWNDLLSLDLKASLSFYSTELGICL